MITKDTLPKLLTSLGYSKRGAVYAKTIGVVELSVDIGKGKITYPDGLTVNGEFTCNFSSPENFVVLECVNRLLGKGYKPEHIELEPKWKLGHGASGGRADILVSDNQKKPLLLIECKTAGREFDKAWHNTLQDGDQLFSYAQQISETQFLCLYASDFDNGILSYQSHIIAHRDNEKYLDDKPDFKGFKSVTDVKERFAVWRDTYKLDFTSKGIFEYNIQPYHIGKDKYSLADLQAISAADQQKKYHEFATILRQHNVSGRENAFDKLVNLLLCKLVDETENPHELKFYWKGVAYDTHFELLDRLQQLYQAGMGKFLGEKITYIDQGTVRNAMRFIRQNPDATQKAVWHLFLQQKFFTNNDFSFIDVHNERLFYQNAEVLLKILQMWQDIRLTNTTTSNQLLGDMFEGFLDQGVKQSEGQYFTPMPICKFILMSLPLENLVQNSATPPKAIDYACGAGHFLNELATQLKPLVAQYKQVEMADYHKSIYGIEKEYRLSKVAKVSAFMYGQQDINICYGDALVNQHAAFPEIQDGSFDVLVANPPYSVRGFLETLSEAERAAYSLADTIDKLDTANSIETFFIERAKQLLKSGGIAALILPSSILSNGGNTYVKTREILLQNFDIVAIAEFGNGTFGKTGTNTVTLFLRRKPTAPDTAEHYRERVAQWFNANDNQTIYQDAHLIDQYAAHIGIPSSQYKPLLAGQLKDELLAHDTFTQYLKVWETSSEIVNLKKQRGFKAKPQAEQDAELGKRLLDFVQSIERDKLYHFVMASDQPKPVLVIRSPSDNKAQKQFLGYEWSSAKGNEGIQISKDANGHHLTLLYDETNRDNAEKINSLIAANFAPSFPSPFGRGARGEGTHVNKNSEAKNSSAFPHPSPLPKGEGVVIPPALREFVSHLRLVDMLDFSRVTFEKQIALAAKKIAVTQSKWPLEKLGDKVNVLIGGTPPRDTPAYFTGENLWVSISEMSGQSIKETKEKITDEAIKKSNVKLIPAGTTLLSFKLSIGKTAIAAVPLYTNEAIAGLVPKDKNEIADAYLFQLFNARQIDLEGNGYKAFGKSLNSTFLKEEVIIPLPPLDVQQQIVTECESIDAEASAAQASIVAARASLSRTLINISPDKQALGQVAHKVSDTIDPQAQTGTAFYIGLENIESGTGQLVGETATPYQEIKSAKIRYQNGDVLYGKLRPNLNKVYLAQQAGICSTDILAFRFDSAIQARFYAAYFLTEVFNSEVIKGVSGQQLPRTSWGNMQTIKVPVLAEAALKKLVTEIEALEHDIASAQAVIAATLAKKQAIMQRYL
ncbi:MAG: N-6 DNA methylase [Gallionella sp.]|nr:N-6 DNA methylase [Gallionella sp.]